MAQPELPAEDPPGAQIQHHGEIVVLPVDKQVGKVLYPGARLDHALVVHAGLRPCFVTEYGVRLERIGWRLYLRPDALAVLSAPSGDGNAGERPDAPGFGLAPAKLGAQATHAVARVLLMDLPQLTNGECITLSTYGRCVVQPAAGNAQDSCSSFAPSWVGCFQDG